MDGVKTYDPTAWSKLVPVDNLASSYAGLGWDGPGLYRQKLADAVAECLHAAYVQKPKGASLLDVACFTGEYYGRLREMGLGFPWSYQGVDVTPEYVAAARKRHAGATFTVGSALDLPKDWKKTADVVLCAGLLIHVDEHARVIAECARVAKSWLVLGVTVDTRVEGDFRTYDQGAEFINRAYRPGYIVDLLRQHGEIQSPPTAVYPEQEGGTTGQGVWVVKL